MFYNFTKTCLCSVLNCIFQQSNQSDWVGATQNWSTCYVTNVDILNHFHSFFVQFLTKCILSWIFKAGVWCTRKQANPLTGMCLYSNPKAISSQHGWDLHRFWSRWWKLSTMTTTISFYFTVPAIEVSLKRFIYLFPHIDKSMNSLLNIHPACCWFVFDS